MTLDNNLGGRSGYFEFLLLGRGEGGPRHPRKGVGGASFLLKVPGGGSPRREEEGRGSRGREGVCGDFPEGPNLEKNQSRLNA